MKKILLIAVLVLFAGQAQAGQVCINLSVKQEANADRSASHFGETKNQIVKQGAVSHLQNLKNQREYAKNQEINDETKNYIYDNHSSIKAQCGASCD